MSVHFFANLLTTPAPASLWQRYHPSLASPVLHEGFLLKTATDAAHLADLRYFILQENYLIYKKTKDSAEMSAALPVTFAQVSFPAEPQFAIRLGAHGRFSVLQATSAADFEQWVAVLSRVALRTDLHDRYIVDRIVSRGISSTVYQASLRADLDTKVLIKGYNKADLVADAAVRQAVWDEIQTMRRLAHPSLQALREVHETTHSVYLVCDGRADSDLGSLLALAELPDRSTVLAVLQGAVRGLAALHSQNIVHRDLKPQHVHLRSKIDLLTSADDVVIADFGLAAHLAGQRLLFKRCGTPGYIAPEIISSANPEHDFKVTTKCDIFSLGVLIYALVCGRSPFEADGLSQEQILRLNVQAKVDWTHPRWLVMPASLKNMVKNMLQVNPKERPSAEEISTSDIFTVYNAGAQRLLSSELTLAKHTPLSVSRRIRNTEAAAAGSLLKRLNTDVSTVDASMGHSKQSTLWTPEGPKPRSRFERDLFNSPKDKTESSFMTKQRKSSFATAEDSGNADQMQGSRMPRSKFGQYCKRSAAEEQPERAGDGSSDQCYELLKW